MHPLPRPASRAGLRPPRAIFSSPPPSVAPRAYVAAAPNRNNRRRGHRAAQSAVAVAAASLMVGAMHEDNCGCVAHVAGPVSAFGFGFGQCSNSAAAAASGPGGLGGGGIVAPPLARSLELVAGKQEAPTGGRMSRSFLGMIECVHADLEIYSSV